MDRAIILERLEMVRRHVATGERVIARQKEMVAKLERDGHDSSTAKQLLRSFEELQKLHLADRGWLEMKLAEVRNEQAPWGSI